MDQKEFENMVKGTIGYMESKDRKIFMDGANVAFIKLSNIYNSELESLKRLVDNEKKAHESLINDITTLSRIISKYNL